MSEINSQELFRSIPKVDEVLQSPQMIEYAEQAPRSVLLNATRSTLEDIRSDIAQAKRTSPVVLSEVLTEIRSRAEILMQASLRRVINATGIIVHTNLGRSILADEAAAAVQEVASAYSTLEYDLQSGERGSRHSHVEDLLCELTGAEAAFAVNNNAAAVMMCIAAFSKGKEALVSRGQLVEIGGSFRVPDIMRESGAQMVELGTTNKTHLDDYERAINENTGLLLKVHSSNYRVLGFTAEVELAELVELGARHGIPVMEDQGSGVLIDLRKYGLPYEPTVQESVAAGADVVTFSGDKLLGGPQAGIIVGKSQTIAKLKKHPLARALRLDKMTLAALEATLLLYRDEKKAVEKIPTLRALTMRALDSKEAAEGLRAKLESALASASFTDYCELEVVSEIARAGGGALPLADIPSYALALKFKDLSIDALERYFRLEAAVPVVARIHEGAILFDPRTLVVGDDDVIIEQIIAFIASR